MDTASKRSSALRAGRSWVLAFPVPDGTISQGDRQHVALAYSGILAESAAVSVALIGRVLVGRNLVGAASAGRNLVGRVL